MSTTARTARFATALAAVITFAACSSAGPTTKSTSTAPATSATTTTVPRTAVSLIAVGDIADCKTDEDTKTAELVRDTNAPIAAVGDLVYENGTAKEFTDCYEPTWGAFKARTFPAPGNHEYNTKGAAPYYAYFGARAATPGAGWYSYEIGDWHVIALNSNCKDIGGCGAGSAQLRWLQQDLAAHKNTCTLAYWHHPRWSSGLHGSNAFMNEIWQTLASAKADVVISGHDHDYERFAPKDASGTAAAGGLRQFVVGTGGRYLTPILVAQPDSEEREDGTWGVLDLRLESNRYAWTFRPINGQTYTDSGSTECSK